jgi:transposase
MVDLVHERDKMVFVDEASFKVSYRRTRGRSLIGTKAVAVIKGVRTKNYSLAAAVSTSGIVHRSCIDGAFNTNYFSMFIESLCVRMGMSLINSIEQLHMNNCILIMDNVAFHKAAAIQEMVQSKGHRLQFLPPYSPFLNPIEELFAQWKAIVKGACPETPDDLFKAVVDGCNSITIEHCQNYFRHMESYLPRCRRGEVITD